MTSRWQRLARIALPAYWVLLFAVTHYPRVPLPQELPSSDKVAHFTAFALLALLWWAFVRARRPLGPRFVWISAGVLLVYAAFDEYVQQYFGRHTDIADFVANAAGIVTALAVLEVRRRLRAR